MWGGDFFGHFPTQWHTFHLAFSATPWVHGWGDPGMPPAPRPRLPYGASFRPCLLRWGTRGRAKAALDCVGIGGCAEQSGSSPGEPSSRGLSQAQSLKQHPGCCPPPVSNWRPLLAFRFLPDKGAVQCCVKLRTAEVRIRFEFWPLPLLAVWLGESANLCLSCCTRGAGRRTP